MRPESLSPSHTALRAHGVPRGPEESQPPAPPPTSQPPALGETHDLLLILVATAVGGGQCGRAGLAVPRHIAELRGAADGQCIDAVGVAVTVAAVMFPAPVPRGPDKDGAQSPTALWTKGGWGHSG
jgi:hypothetical protein